MNLPPQLQKTPVQLGILFATLFLYLLSIRLFPGNGQVIPTVLGLLVFVEMVGFVFLEIKTGVHKHGWKHEAVDTFLALIVALLLWFGVSFLLNTSTPVSGVVSCSMKPNLQRGDFVIVQGAAPLGYAITLTKNDLEALNRGIASVEFNGSSMNVSGSMYSFCSYNPGHTWCAEFLKTPEYFKERIGPFAYNYKSCSVAYDGGRIGSGPCVVSVDFNNRTYFANFSHDIIVYEPGKDQLFGLFGDIVHRVFFIAEVDGAKYYIAKGDNNPVFDIQMYLPSSALGNLPVPQNKVKGKLVGRVPLLGYFKLLLHFYVQEDQQCTWQLNYPHV
jgi:signal peptidase I